jgi:hypothetical protein
MLVSRFPSATTPATAAARNLASPLAGPDDLEVVRPYSDPSRVFCGFREAARR